MRAQGVGVREIARRIGRSPSTVSRELRRNAATRGGRLEYRASVAQWKAELMARRPKTAKLAVDDAVARVCAGAAVRARCVGRTGRRSPGPATAPWNGRNKPRRKDRRWATAWSPEQISNRLRVDFPDDESMRISHEAIYQSLYVQGRGALRRELVACLRTGRALRVPRARVGARGKNFVTERDHDQRAARRGRGPGRSRPLGRRSDPRPRPLGDRHAGGALEPVHDAAAPPAARARASRRVKNGPPVTGHGADAVRDAIAAAITTLPEQLRRSLTWDQGAEMAQHAKLRIDTGLQVYFCDPQSPWQRGTNENTNGLLRQYFPKGTDLARHSAEDLAAVAASAQQPASQDARLENPSRGPRRAPRHRHDQLPDGAHAAIAAPARPRAPSATTATSMH